MGGGLRCRHFACGEFGISKDTITGGLMLKQIAYGGGIRDLFLLTATRRYASGEMVEEMSSVGKLCMYHDGGSRGHTCMSQAE